MAALCSQHSPMLGQRASSQTVCSPSSRIMRLDVRVVGAARGLHLEPGWLARRRRRRGGEGPPGATGAERVSCTSGTATRSLSGIADRPVIAAKASPGRKWNPPAGCTSGGCVCGRRCARLRRGLLLLLGGPALGVVLGERLGVHRDVGHRVAGRRGPPRSPAGPPGRRNCTSGRRIVSSYLRAVMRSSSASYEVWAKPTALSCFRTHSNASGAGAGLAPRASWS